jgi:hypothetical protein
MIGFPIAYFGSVRYLQEMTQHNTVILEINDHFPKQTFRNRAVILSSQGSQTLTVPLIKPNGSKTLTKDIGISYTEKWQLIHWRAIQTAYASAPYFEHYACDIQALIFNKANSLVELNRSILDFFIETWQLPIQLNYSTHYNQVETIDLDFEIEPMRKSYTQVIFDNREFNACVSALDLLFCEGPMARNIILTKF